MNTRLKQFIAAENITQAQFADTINVVRASVSHILAGRNKPSYEFICGLMRHYPNLNIEWLMFGKGKMYREPSAGQADLFETHAEPIIATPEPQKEIFETEYSAEPAAPIQKQPISQPVTATVPNGVTLNEIKALVSEMQKPVHQRKLVKITAFFDDGTFQELTTI